MGTVEILLKGAPSMIFGKCRSASPEQCLGYRQENRHANSASADPMMI
jgi:hypothetical protein